jgi:hypothetical protein
MEIKNVMRVLTLQDYEHVCAFNKLNCNVSVSSAFCLVCFADLL